jgi:hypothetical protein
MNGRQFVAELVAEDHRTIHRMPPVEHYGPGSPRSRSTAVRLFRTVATVGVIRDVA